MKLIVGLGNPGDKYEKTRHNLGFSVVEHLLKDFETPKKSIWDDSKKLKSDIFIFDHETTEKIILAKPKTFMNDSGLAVSLISSFYKVKPENIWIIHDELDLPLGTMKIRFGGAAAGHHGVESIIASLKTDKFWRFRLGIGEAKNHSEIARRKIRKADEFVLDSFNSHESGTVKHLIKRASEAIQTALQKDLQSAMNRYNTK